MSGEPLRIGMVCYPTYGGSGVLATALAEALGRRGHTVHLLCAERPVRLTTDAPGVRFHAVRAPDYPVFPEVPYALAVASAIVDIARRDGLDVVHAHYAVPHATSGWMAREVLGGGPALVTTLHGTDITLVGSDPSYLPITRHSVLASDAVTTPSAWLRDQTWARFDLAPERVPVDVVPNFVDPAVLASAAGAGTGQDPRGTPVVAHVSNFRALKRVDRVVDVFARVARRRPCRLLLVGDGPERAAIEARVRGAGLSDRVTFAGERQDVGALLVGCAAFLLPSDTESFGLAALEALACGVPVIASDVGGLPEVVRHGVTGWLAPPDDLAAMATCLDRLLADPESAMNAGRRGARDASERFGADAVVERYLQIYERVRGPRAL